MNPGDRVGRFEVVRELGAGGMGVVFEARDPELGRKVAIKLLHARGGNAMRLLREAQALARISHPNVIGVHELDTHDGQVFVVMELVDGTTLDRAIAGKPWRAVVDAYVAAGRGLAAVHEAGLVHRDVKPSNVLVDRAGRIRIGDFGLARGLGTGGVDGVARAASFDAGEATLDEVTASSGDDGRGDAPRADAVDDGRLAAPLTAAGAVVGTPAYMAPEQKRSSEVTAKADQYAYCVALWEALTGARPSTREADATAARRAGLPRWLVAALARGLAEDPAERWPSVSALVDELERHRPGRRRLVIGAIAVGAIGAAAAIGGVLAGGGGAGGGGGGGDPVRCDTAAAEAERAWTPARRDAITAAFAATKLPDPADASRRTLAAIDGWLAGWRDVRIDACRAVHERGDESDAMLDKRAACLDAELAAFDALANELAHADAKAASRALDAAGVLPPPELCSAARLGDVAAPSRDPRAAEVERAIAAGKSAYDVRRAAAHELTEKAVAAARTLRDPDLLARALVIDARAIRGTDPRRARTELDEAQSEAAQAHDAAVEADALDDAVEDAAASHDGARIEALLPVYRAAVRRSGDSRYLRRLLAETEADAAIALGHPDDARAACKRAQDLADDDRSTAIALDCACAVAIQIRDVPAAVPACKIAYEGRLREYGSESAKAKGGADVSIIALERAGRGDEAAALQVDNLARTTRLFGERSIEMLNELGNYAAVLDVQGKTAESAATLRKGLALLDDLHAPRDQHRYGFLSDLAARETTLGDIPAAIRDGDAALAAAEALLGPDHPELVPVLVNVARAHGHAQVPADRDHAKALFERAVALAQARSKTSGVTGGVLADYGGFLVDTGRAADAVQVLQPAVDILRASGAPARTVADAQRRLDEARAALGKLR